MVFHYVRKLAPGVKYIVEPGTRNNSIPDRAAVLAGIGTAEVPLWIRLPPDTLIAAETAGSPIIEQTPTNAGEIQKRAASHGGLLEKQFLFSSISLTTKPVGLPFITIVL